MAPDTVKAAWSGPYDGELPDGSVVRAGDVLEIPAELAESGHWTKVVESAPERPPVRSPATQGGDS